MSETALLVIDVQQAVCHYLQDAHDLMPVIGRINTLSAHARAHGWPVVIVQHDEADGPLQRGEAGWQLHPAVQVEASDLHVYKQHGDSFEDTDLLGLLQARGIRRVVTCGLQSDFCVNATSRGGLSRGMAVVLASDAHTTHPNGEWSAAALIDQINVNLSALGADGVKIEVASVAQITEGLAA